MKPQVALDASLTVEQFTSWWLKSRPIRPPFVDGTFFTDLAASCILYRNGPFQVEMYVSKPDTEATWHSHPGVDSILLYLTGNLVFGKDGEYKDTDEWQKPHADAEDVHALFGQYDALHDNQLHNLKTKKEGGAFLSFEKWHDKVPNSVTVNWEGPPTGVLHKTVMANANTTSNAS
jgi:hypothetical protein